MKIVDISEFYSEHGGGVRTYVKQKLEASARLGHETLIIAPGAEHREEPCPGGKIIWVKAPKLIVDPRYHVFWNADAVREIVMREAPDVIEGSSPWRGGWIAATNPTNAVKVLVMHADPVAVYPHTALGSFLATRTIDRLFGWFWSYLRRLNRHFDATVVAGNWLARRFESFGLHGLHALPFGVDKTVFTPAARRADIRKAMLRACDLQAEDRILVAVGRHHPEKRLDKLIDAVARVNRTRRVGLFMIGDGLYRARVERWAAKVPHVHIAGHVADRSLVAAYVASADALLHGSASETFGLALAEAISCGTPIIVPNAGGAADFADPACAEIYSPGDSVDAAGAIERLLERDNDLLRSEAEATARQRVANAGAHFDDMFHFYEELLAQKRANGL